jgi:hypothetical protein
MEAIQTGPGHSPATSLGVAKQILRDLYSVAQRSHKLMPYRIITYVLKSRSVNSHDQLIGGFE